MRTNSKSHFRSRIQRQRRFAASRFDFERLEDRKLLASLAFESVGQAGGDVGSVQVYSVAVDSVDNSYVGGLFYSNPVDFDLDNSHVGDVDILTPRGDNDAFLAKYDANNNFVWARRMGGDAIKANANSPFERLKEVVIDSQDNVLVVGEFTESADFGSFTLNSTGSADAFVAKLDGEGVFLWAKQWGTATRDFGSTLALDANNRATAVGFTTNLEPNGAWTASGIEIYQFDTNGNEVWSQQIPAYGASAGHVDTDALGNVIITGDFAGTVDMDASSNVSYVTGSSTVTGGAGRNSYILKLSSDGNFQWASALVAKTSEDSNSSAWAAEVLFDPAGDVVIAGQYYGQVDLDPSVNDHRLPAALPGSYFAKLDSGTGALISLQAIGEGVTIRDLAASGSNYYATGSYQDTATPGSGWTLTSNGASDIFVMELSQTGYVNNVIGLGETSNDYGYSIATNDSGGVHVAGTFRGDVDFDPDPNSSHVLSNASFADMFLLRLNKVAASEPIVVFEDSFEVSEWNGNWVEDSQNDWFRSSQRATHGSLSAEVDGSASNATLTMYTPIDLSAFTSVQLTFDWLIESGFDSGEYLGIDISTDGGANWQNDVRRLSGNVDSEDVWHSESVDLLAYCLVERACSLPKFGQRFQRRCQCRQCPHHGRSSRPGAQ